MTNVPFYFEEIQPRNSAGKLVSGIMLYGCAELESSRRYDPHDPDAAFEFYVASVTIEGGNTITMDHAKAFPNSPDAFFYNAVALAVEDDETAQAVFSAKVEKDAENDFWDRADYLYEQSRDRAMEGAE